MQIVSFNYWLWLISLSAVMEIYIKGKEIIEPNQCLIILLYRKHTGQYLVTLWQYIQHDFQMHS